MRYLQVSEYVYIQPSRVDSVDTSRGLIQVWMSSGKVYAVDLKYFPGHLDEFLSALEFYARQKTKRSRHELGKMFTRFVKGEHHENDPEAGGTTDS